MNRTMSQLPLNERIPALAQSVRSARAMVENYRKEEASLMDELARAEAEVTGKAPNSAGVPLSGLIPEGENPHQPGNEPIEHQSFIEEAGEGEPDEEPESKTPKDKMDELSGVTERRKEAIESQSKGKPSSK